MGRVFLAEGAILVHGEFVGIVFLVLHRVVIALFVITAQRDFHAHIRRLL